MYNVGELIVRFSQCGYFGKFPFSWELVISDGLAVCWFCEVKALKEMFLKTVIFMPLGSGCIAKFEASFQAAYFAMICFPSDDGEDFLENFFRCPWQLSSGRH